MDTKLPLEYFNTSQSLNWPYAVSETELLRRVRNYNNQKFNRKANVVFYTALIGAYDPLIIPETIIDEWDYIVFTDADISGEHIFDIRRPVYQHTDPTRIARFHKINSHLLLSDYDYSIWIDANILVRGTHLFDTIDSFINSDDLIICNPHPHRSCTYEELDACIRLGKDDPAIMENQVQRYREEGFPEMQGMFETGILIRRNTSKRIVKLNEDWWYEINNASRRDQLSFPYVLHKNHVKCKNLERMKDIRIHEGNDYCLFPHIKKRKKTKAPSYTVPSFMYNEFYQKSKYASASNTYNDSTLKQYEQEIIDIIICVHNALDDVKKCLESVIECMLDNHRLIIIDDGSDEDTRRYLISVDQKFNNLKLIRQEEAKGYTISANTGLKISDSDFKILLNSDTIVNRNWSLKLLQAANSSKSVGIVGPLSNAASWQSVPVVTDPNKKGIVFVINELPADKTISEMDRLCEIYGWQDQFPVVPLVNGFCYGIKKKVIDKIGYFDDIAFPKGFGEEDDFTLRAIDAGFDCVIATHCYVYHAKSKSFGKTTRSELAEKSGNYLRNKYGYNRISNLMRELQNHPKLRGIRKNIEKACINQYKSNTNEINSKMIYSDSVFEIARLNDEIRKKEHIISKYKKGKIYSSNDSITIRQIKIEREQLINWMSRLNRDFEALRVSRRWKLGQYVGRLFQVLTFKNDLPTAMDEIIDIFDKFEKLNRNHRHGYLKAKSRDSKNAKVLIKSLNALKSDFKAFINSRRWRIGNGLLKICEKFLMRPNILLATDHMATIFEEFETWEQTRQQYTSKPGLSFAELEQLEKWMRALDGCFQATMKSYRWRTGSKIVEIFGWLIYRNNEPIVTEHMQKIFSDYRQQFYPDIRHHQNTLAVARRPSIPINTNNNPYNNIDEVNDLGSGKQGQKKNLAIQPYSVGVIQFLFQNLGFTQRGSADLQKIAKDCSQSSKQQHAAWILANWYSNEYDIKSAERCLEILEIAARDKSDPDLLQKIAVIRGECHLILGNNEEAKRVIHYALSETRSADLFFAASNLESSIKKRIVCINKALEIYGLSNLFLSENKESPPYDRLISKGTVPKAPREIIDKHKVSIIIPALNSENTIATALDSILSQTWYNLEVIVVDDCSTDDTASKVSVYKNLDPRVKLIRSNMNNGPYISRNLALQTATGDFVTCNDADDWSHPQKIELQALHLINNPKCIANISKWARLTNDLVFYRRGNPGFYIQPNVSSLMFRRKPVMKRLGFWDSVRFGADTELFIRIRKAFGIGAIEEKKLGLLSFGRSTAHSLTENDTFGYPGFPMGARKEYRESYLYHHDATRKFKYPFPQTHRPFPIPDIMRPVEPTNGKREFSPEVVIAFDFRLPTDSLLVIDELQALKETNLKIGLVQMAIYDIAFKRQRIANKIRALIDGEQVKMVVYGEKVHCDTLLIRSPVILQEKQKYIPNIQASKICVLIDRLPYQSLGMQYDIDRCENHLRSYFDGRGIWYPATSIIRRNLNKHYQDNFKSIELSDQNWSPSLITGKSTPDDQKNDVQINTTKSLISEECTIKFIDVKNLDSFAHFNTSNIVVVMPCVDTTKGKATAEMLARRAGIDCTILIMHDTVRQGFIKTLNDTSARVKARYIVYLAEDAFPGRQWLRRAYESLEKNGKGLLGFNDGKWTGRIASFGMVQTDWVQGIYQGPVFWTEYKSHKADNELTVIARASDMYIYNPDCVLVEHDPEKDVKPGSNPIDDEIFNRRFLSGFNGILPFENIKHLAKEYKVKINA